MEPIDEPIYDPDKKIVFIRITNNSNPMWTPPENLVEWLQNLIANTPMFEDVEQSMLDAENSADFIDEFGNPSIMQELDYLDSTVSGDEHPEALSWIMNAYHNPPDKANLV